MKLDQALDFLETINTLRGGLDDLELQLAEAVEMGVKRKPKLKLLRVGRVGGAIYRFPKRGTSSKGSRKEVGPR